MVGWGWVGGDGGVAASASGSVKGLGPSAGAGTPMALRQGSGFCLRWPVRRYSHPGILRLHDDSTGKVGWVDARVRGPLRGTGQQAQDYETW